MKNRLLLFLKYVNRFGFFSGLIIYMELTLLKKEVVRLKGFGKISIRKNSSDFDVFNQVIVGNEYDIPLETEPKFIIDGGANVGLTSIFFAKKFKRATIVAFEPDSLNFQQLQSNTEGKPQIHCEEKAIWYHTEGVQFMRSGSADSHFVSNNQRDEEKVPTVTIASIMNSFQISHVDLLKLDIEGAEKEIFESSDLQWLNKVRTLVIELHDRFKPGCSMSLFNALSGFTYTISIKGELLIINIVNK